MRDDGRQVAQRRDERQQVDARHVGARGVHTVTLPRRRGWHFGNLFAHNVNDTGRRVAGAEHHMARPDEARRGRGGR